MNLSQIKLFLMLEVQVNYSHAFILDLLDCYMVYHQMLFINHGLFMYFGLHCPTFKYLNLVQKTIHNQKSILETYKNQVNPMKSNYNLYAIQRNLMNIANDIYVWAKDKQVCTKCKEYILLNQTRIKAHCQDLKTMPSLSLSSQILISLHLSFNYNNEEYIKHIKNEVKCINQLIIIDD